jgi:hypothetical protein
VKNQYQKQSIKANQLLTHISAVELAPLIKRHRADFSANKLHTLIFLKLFLYAWTFDRRDISLRTIAHYSHSRVFRQLAELDDVFSVDKSALGKRLSHIPAQLFQDIFEQLARETLVKLPPAQAKSKAVTKLLGQSRMLDSTIITLSAKLLKEGYQIHEGQLSVKASMAIASRSIPVTALVNTDDTYSSENKALPELFDLTQAGIIYVFDRGIHKQQTYAEIVSSGNHFLSRTFAKRYQVIKTNKLPDDPATDTLTVINDEVIIFPQKQESTQTPFRLITAVSKRDDTELRFITSLMDVPAIDLTDLYRYRWSIEIFFRFLKHELQLENPLSYSANGLKVHIYLTLIAFLLTWAFKEENHIKSFKRARERLKMILLDQLMEQTYRDGARASPGVVETTHTS